MVVVPATGLPVLKWRVISPATAWMIDAIHDRIMPLSGHQLSTNPTTGELLKRQREVFKLRIVSILTSKTNE